MTKKFMSHVKSSSSLTNNIDYDSIKPTISPNTQQIKNIEFQNSHLVGVTEIKGYIQENIIQRKTAGKIYFGYFNTQIAESNIETPVLSKEMKQLEYMQQQIASKLSLAPHIYDFIEIEEKNKKFIVMEKQDPCSSIVDHEILIGKKGEENVIQLAIKLQQLQEKWEESNYYLQKCPYHGDIKPENMTYNKDIGNLNLIDFKYDLQDITSTPFYSKFIELQDNLMTLEKNELVNKGFTTQINFKKSKATDFIAFFRSILSLKFVNQIDYSKIISFATNILEKKYESEVLNRIKQTKLCNIKKNHFNNIDARKKFLFMFLWQLYNNCILKVMDDEKTDYENGLFIFIKKNIMK